LARNKDDLYGFNQVCPKHCNCQNSSKAAGISKCSASEALRVFYLFVHKFSAIFGTMKKIIQKFSVVFLLLFAFAARANFILLPMDETTQKNHLKAYGITYWCLDKQYKASWLLNYRGGSFLLPDAPEIRKECQIRGVSFEVLSDGETNQILDEISSPSQNMETVVLEKAPKIAVYTPKGKQPWDDAVTMVLTYAEIPFTPIYDEEVLSDQLILYDWLHLHHEDFTGQYGKFFGMYRNAPWYIDQKRG
jgi:hypothetical protein